MAKIEKLGIYSNASVLKNTGKEWDEWVRLLNKNAAKNLTHQEIVALLKTKYKLGPWWQQAVTGGYEIHIGRRIEGQNIKGEYTVTSTKTFPVSQKTMWKLMTSPHGLEKWLAPLSPLEFRAKAGFEVRGGIYGSVRTLQAPKRARLSWQDDEWPKATVINLNIVARPGDKCIVALSHEGLKDRRLKEKMRDHWKSALDSLLAYVLNIKT